MLWMLDGFFERDVLRILGYHHWDTITGAGKVAGCLGKMTWNNNTGWTFVEKLKKNIQDYNKQC